MPPKISLPQLRATDLEVSIGNKALTKPFSVNMRATESWAILGANGTGKTTLLLTLAGLNPARSGSISVAGKELASSTPRQLAQYRSVLFQKTDDPFPATVMDTVLSARHPHISYWQTENATDYKIAHDSLAAVDMSGFASRDIQSLSGGERQRVAIATTLAQGAAVRFFDEPSNHLDLKHQHTILKLLTQESNNLNILVLQDINQAWNNCTHALLMYQNNLVETGLIKEMLTLEKLENLYSCRLKIISDGDEKVFVHS